MSFIYGKIKYHPDFTICQLKIHSHAFKKKKKKRNNGGVIINHSSF